MTFKELGLEAPLLKALEEQGYKQPTPIQQQSIPILLEGKDLLGVAQTGTGKTAAFGIPILNNLIKDTIKIKGKRKVKALIIAPTRELAIQIGDNFNAYIKYTNLKTAMIFGGVKPVQQIKTLQYGVDILIATPGRLLDLMDLGHISFKDLKHVVLDEADQMLDMGFIHDIKKIIAKLPAKRQSLFFSATMPKSIVELSKKMLGDFERVTIKPQQATAEKVTQGIYFVSKQNKPKLLVHLLNEAKDKSVLVFSRTKHGANKIVKKLEKADIKAAAIHGNKSQAARQKALSAFKEGKLKVLVATDIAARGIDVDELSLVINHDLPNVPETYVHRIGRTGRANASGTAISFCMGEERPYLKDIEKLIKQKVPNLGDHPFMQDTQEIEETSTPVQREKKERSSTQKKPRSRNRNGNRNRDRDRDRDNRGSKSSKKPNNKNSNSRNRGFSN
ncbi:ATP-dependent RNA helicase RhlE [Tenacibaculum sp. MAR_2009_124]|uniref:DEAD/DEAH box helicase n=1 Tax=Tenacibaculum sp. MAR_2009_124 TaxID=1250059 RepID=UPI00089DA2D1|nr:DEAD/DEAH box helicase [Tenacibaculum sp. MAR_2009_124]SEC82057.1 ATP-dependent RNA helicase RhlE [Tenacibaculum sp. MAR_2009_124]